MEKALTKFLRSNDSMETGESVFFHVGVEQELMRETSCGIES